MLSAFDIRYTVNGRQLIGGVSLSLEPGILNLVIGPNGAGKSTLIKLLSGLLRPEHGSIRYEGREIGDLNEIELARRRAVLSQAIEIAFPLAVREVVMMGRYPHFGGRPGPRDDRIVDQMMRLFDVAEFADRDYRTLSGGEQQRVNFARILAQLWRLEDDVRPHGCRYLFLDEPLTFLDVRHQIDFMKKIQEFARRRDVVTVGVVHDLNVAAKYAGRVIALDRGGLAADGEPARVLTPETIHAIFGVENVRTMAVGGDLHLAFD